MLRHFVLYPILIAACGVSFCSADFPQTVDLGYATYQGTFNSTANTTNFLGIRYASPPVGKHERRSS